MEFLQGGRENKIARVANTVRRPCWPLDQVGSCSAAARAGGGIYGRSPNRSALMRQATKSSPFWPGRCATIHSAPPPPARKRWSRRPSCCAPTTRQPSRFLTKTWSSHTWLLPTQTPVEVICHGDFAPYNVVLNGRQAVGIIDFDTAHPGPRLWDIAYALYRWAPFTHPQNPDGLGDLTTQIGRARLFCDAYGFPAAQRPELVDAMILRLETLVSYMQAEAQKGNEAFIANLADGHHLLYLADIKYLGEKRPFILAGLQN
jgi:hypothetical protein